MSHSVTSPPFTEARKGTTGYGRPPQASSRPSSRLSNVSRFGDNNPVPNPNITILSQPKGTGFVTLDKKWNRETFNTYNIISEAWKNDPSQQYFNIKPEEQKIIHEVVNASHSEASDDSDKDFRQTLHLNTGEEPKKINLSIGEIELLSKEAAQEDAIRDLNKSQMKGGGEKMYPELLSVNRHRVGDNKVQEFYEAYKDLDKAIQREEHKTHSTVAYLKSLEEQNQLPESLGTVSTKGKNKTLDASNLLMGTTKAISMAEYLKLSQARHVNLSYNNIEPEGGVKLVTQLS